MEKTTPKKAREKKCSRKKSVKLKSEHFLSLWALGPGSEHPWMPESFIIWQPGSAVQFYLLAGGKWSSTRSPHSQRASKREGDGDKERDRRSEKQSFMQKQPLESFMATHEPCLFILCSSLRSNISLCCLLHFLMWFSSRSKMPVII